MIGTHGGQAGTNEQTKSEEEGWTDATVTSEGQRAWGKDREDTEKDYQNSRQESWTAQRTGVSNICS